MHDLSGMVCQLNVVKFRSIICHLEGAHVNVARETTHSAFVWPCLFAAYVDEAPYWLFVRNRQRERAAAQCLYRSWGLIELTLWETMEKNRRPAINNFEVCLEVRHPHERDN